MGNPHLGISNWQSAPAQHIAPAFLFALCFLHMHFDDGLRLKLTLCLHHAACHKWYINVKAASGTKSCPINALQVRHDCIMLQYLAYQTMITLIRHDRGGIYWRGSLIAGTQQTQAVLRLAVWWA